MLIQKYNYKPLNREEVNGVRHYVTPDGELVPSVTTIIDITQSREKRQAIKEWRAAVGVQRATAITTEAASRGTRMHKYLENYIKTGVLPEAGTNPFAQQSNKMANIVVSKGLINVTEFWGTEASLYFPKVYAGTTDCVAVWGNKPAILDFKQTNKPKDNSKVEDYFVQLCAYATAHNELFGTNIKTGVILMCSQDFQYQEWVLEGAEFEHWNNIWWHKLEQYYEALTTL